jgi:CRISPR/Cas system-associated endonuclease Cas1
MIDDNLRPVTSGPVTDDRVRALERSLDDLQETVGARRSKGKEAKAWEAMYEALRQISMGSFSYRSDPDIQMFANCLFFDRARQVWTKKIAKLPT